MTPSIACEVAESRMLDALKGDEAARLELADHLEVCASCRQAWLELQETWAWLDPSIPQPVSARLRDAFVCDLDAAENAPPAFAPLRRILENPVLQVAAVVLLVLGGFALGLRANLKSLAGIPREKPERILLAQGGPRERLMAIALLTQGQRPDPALAELLLERVARDPDIHVRLMAIDALYLFADQRELKKPLLECLARESSPEVQKALVDLIASLRERRATEALKTLLRDGSLAPAVEATPTHGSAPTHDSGPLGQKPASRL